MALVSTVRPPQSDDRMTVMIVELGVVVRLVIAEYLRDCGCRVIEGAGADDV